MKPHTPSSDSASGPIENVQEQTGSETMVLQVMRARISALLSNDSMLDDVSDLGLSRSDTEYLLGLFRPSHPRSSTKAFPIH